MYKKFGKRIFDVVLSAIGIILLCPVFLLLSIILVITNQGSVIFRQARPGLHEKVFTLLKFKTMRDQHGTPEPDQNRVTRIGNFLRKTSLDEIPQLWNVLAGNMSLVGPRPLLVEYLPLYQINQRKRHDVRPGITGWAQIHGRNAITWEQKFDYDLWYVGNVSLFLDLKILVLTCSQAFSVSKIRSLEITDVEKFNG